MAVLSLQEQTTREERKDLLQRELAELKHVRESDAYKRILYADSTAEAVEAKAALAEDTVVQEPETDFTHTAKQRIADYRAYSAPAESRKLFEGIVYKDGKLQSEEGDVLTAPAQPRAETVEIPAPVCRPDNEEDATPTRRTMETLRRAEIETAATVKPHLFSVLSTKAKIALVSVVCAIVLAIVFICVNTAILNSIHANNDSLRSRLQEQQETYQRLSEQIHDMENGEGSYAERIEEYATANGMVKD